MPDSIDGIDDKYENTLANGIKIKRNEEYNWYFGYGKDKYGDDVISVRWYFFQREEWSKYFSEKEYRAQSCQELYQAIDNAKGEYRYHCTHRPPSRGCIPSDFITYESFPLGQRYCGEVTYNRSLTDDECNRWGLVINEEHERFKKINHAV